MKFGQLYSVKMQTLFCLFKAHFSPEKLCTYVYVHIYLNKVLWDPHGGGENQCL